MSSNFFSESKCVDGFGNWKVFFEQRKRSQLKKFLDFMLLILSNKQLIWRNCFFVYNSKIIKFREFWPEIGLKKHAKLLFSNIDYKLIIIYSFHLFAVTIYSRLLFFCCTLVKKYSNFHAVESVFFVTDRFARFSLCLATV